MSLNSAYSTLPELPRCANCGQNSHLQCGICTNQGYCSVKCQEAMWTAHKSVCRGALVLDYPPPPTDRSQGLVRGFHFGGPINGPINGPIFAFFRYTKSIPSTSYMELDLGGLLAVSQEEAISGDYEAPAWFDITRDTDHQVDLGYTIRLVSRDGFLDANRASAWESEEVTNDDTREENDDKENPMVNKAIRALSQMPDLAHDWQGPALAFGIRQFTDDGHPKKKRSLFREDSRYLKNFFNGLRDPITTVACVRINCNGDVEAGGRPKFEPIELPLHHAIFEQSAASVSTLINLPVTVARIPGNIGLCMRRANRSPNVNQAGGSPNVNHAVTFLHRCCDPNKTDDGNLLDGQAPFGFVPFTWATPVGSCIIARHDKKPLHPDHVAALTQYCQYHLLSFFQTQMKSESKEGPVNGLPKSFVLDEITEPKFKQYWEVWKMEQDGWESQLRVSPYDVC